LTRKTKPAPPPAAQVLCPDCVARGMALLRRVMWRLREDKALYCVLRSGRGERRLALKHALDLLYGCSCGLMYDGTLSRFRK